MSCHISCTTCSSSLFNQCLSCPSLPLAVLSNGACFCTVPWDSNCTNILNLRSFFQIVDTLFMAIIPLLMLCYCLKAKLLISYRILVGLQSISMLLFTTQSYLNYQSIFVLTTLYKSNGYYNFTYRNQTISYSYILPASFLFISFLILFLILQKPRHLFVKNEEDYLQYLKDNAYQFFSYFYMFGSRSMLYFIGLWLKTMQISMFNMIFVSICGLFVVISIVKAVKNFHQNKIQDQIYQPELYLYNLLSPLSLIGLPLATTTISQLFIYLSPIVLLFLIIIFNKNYVIFTKQKFIFYLCQLLIAGLAIAFIMVDYTIKGIVGMIIISLGILIIIIEISISYYGGYDLKSSKVHPETQNTFHEIKRQEIDKNIFKSTYKKQSNYL